MNVGGYQVARARSHLRAAVNARLEEISFRAGLIAATTTLVALSAIATAGVYAATLGHESAAGGPIARSAPVTAPASVLPRTPRYPRASLQPKVQQPVTARTTSPQPGSGRQSPAEADGPGPWSPQARSRDYGRTTPDGDRSWFGSQGPWPGDSGIPGPGRWGPGLLDGGRSPQFRRVSYQAP